MTIRPLPDIDLARFAAIDDDEMLRVALRAQKANGGSWSYNPFRRSTSDLLSVSTPLLGRLRKVSLSKILDQIAAACAHGAKQTASNREIARILWAAAQEGVWRAVHYPMGRRPTGMDQSVRYWADVIVEDEDGPFIPFFEERRNRGLASPKARRVVFSMQHHTVRARDLDLADARLAIIRFPAQGEQRSFKVHFASETDIMPIEELETRIEKVYRVWAEVWTERTAEVRKTGTGGSTPLGF